jgi:hypothetical protein
MKGVADSSAFGLGVTPYGIDDSAPLEFIGGVR